MNRAAKQSGTFRWRALALAAATTAALAGAAVPAVAGPWHGAMHGAAGGAPVDRLIPDLLENAKASLNLNTSQQLMWDNAVAATRAARESGRANREQVKSALGTELAKAEPDLAALATTADTVEQQNRALRLQVRAQWLALYATFSPEQKAVVKTLLQERIAKAESLRERIREKFRGSGKPAG